MRRSWVWVVAVVLAVGVSTSWAESKSEGRPFVGVDVGVMQPTAAFDQYTDTGGVLAPFIGYMFNKNLGIMGQLQLVGAPNRDRVGVKDDDATWIFGGAAGPRLAVPLGDGELYGTAQGGIFTGLAPNSVTDTSFGFSAGAGINGPITDDMLMGVWVRYNRLYQRIHATGDVEYVSAGIGLTFDLGPKAPPPPPAPVCTPVVQAAAPPPPPPAPVVKKKIVLRGVRFDFGKAEIRSDARPVLDAAVAALKEAGDVQVLAVGHTDGVGPEAYNEKLSILRAEAVRNYLVKAGIPADRIHVEGKGETMPVASNDTPDGRAQNRRVELKVVE